MSAGKDSQYSSTAFSKPHVNLNNSNESLEEIEIIKINDGENFTDVPKAEKEQKQQ